MKEKRKERRSFLSSLGFEMEDLPLTASRATRKQLSRRQPRVGRLSMRASCGIGRPPAFLAGTVRARGSPCGQRPPGHLCDSAKKMSPSGSAPWKRLWSREIRVYGQNTLAAALIMVGPPMSMFSIPSSNETPPAEVTFS